MYYHGSKSIFKEFDKDRIGQNFTYSEDSGFFFTINKSRAEGHTGPLDHPGFIFEVDLTFDNPARYQTNSELYTPADYFDIHCADLLREAFIAGNDALFIKGTQEDDVVVVFEPDQIKINRIFQSGKLVYDHEHPEQTAYPDIMGKDIPSSVNSNTKPFHYDHANERLNTTVTSLEFGDRLNDDIGKKLMKEGVAYTNDGRHFGMGEDFRNLVLSLFCEGNAGDASVYQCRENCLVICDFDEGVTMVQDLKGTNKSLAELALREMTTVAGAVKTFIPEEDSHGSSRSTAHIIGPGNIVDEILSLTPDYLLDFTSVVRATPSKPEECTAPSTIMQKHQEYPSNEQRPSLKL